MAAAVLRVTSLESSRTTSEVPTGFGAGEGSRCTRSETRGHMSSIAVFILLTFLRCWMVLHQLWSHRARRDVFSKQSDRFGGPYWVRAGRLAPKNALRNAWATTLLLSSLFMATMWLDVDLLNVRPPGFTGRVQKAVGPLWGSGLGPLASFGVEGHLTKRVWDSHGQQNTLSLLREGSVLA